jgi:hypothetical protein
MEKLTKNKYGVILGFDEVLPNTNKKCLSHIFVAAV